MLKRWRAEAHYKTESGLVTFKHEFDELDELHDLIEAGPDWTTVDRIEVRYSLDFVDLAPERSPRQRLQIVK